MLDVYEQLEKTKKRAVQKLHSATKPVAAAVELKAGFVDVVVAVVMFVRGIFQGQQVEPRQVKAKRDELPGQPNITYFAK